MRERVCVCVGGWGGGHRFVLPDLVGNFHCLQWLFNSTLQLKADPKMSVSTGIYILTI